MPGFPDPKTCLLNQKLQMINCCIERKNSRERAALSGNNDMEASEESEDEFFDCAMETNAVGLDEYHRRPKYSLWNKPTGRRCRHGKLRLVTTGEPLYIPITQDATPKTEDQLEEDAEVLTQLGCDTQGSELRARMMSASLLSDMESFKAANPGAILADFIRWYSPRDWIEEEELDEFGQKKGQLSARMLLAAGNTWQEVWSAAKPVPARRQKRLFDDTREAEKALHFLESRRPAAMAQLLLPALSHAALITLMRQASFTPIPNLQAVIDRIASRVEALSRVPIVDIRRYQEVCNDVADVEVIIAHYTSLQHKLCPSPDPGPELNQFLADLVTQPVTAVPGGARGDIANRIRAMFTEAHKVAQMIYDSDPVLAAQNEAWSPISSSVFPKPSEREFIMRVRARRPGAASSLLPQRMTVQLRKDDIVMAGCFMQDTTFR